MTDHEEEFRVLFQRFQKGVDQTFALERNIARDTSALEKLSSEREQLKAQIQDLINQYPELDQLLRELQLSHAQTVLGMDQDQTRPST